MKSLILTAVSLLCAAGAYALSADHYAASSRLSSGDWVKISVSETGMHRITNSQLRQWGFSNPANVRVYGYGGARIPDVLSQDNYIDDLPAVQAAMDDQGIVFYGVGPENWAASSGGVRVSNPNIYSSLGYYFLCETSEALPDIPAQGLPQASAISDSTYLHCQQHEYDRTSPGEAGYLLVGESFTSQSTRKFTFSLPPGEAMLECGIVYASSFDSSVKFTVNGQVLEENSTDKLSAVATSTYLHAALNQSVHSFTSPGGDVEISISVASASSMSDCWLDYLAVNVTAPLELPSDGWLVFSAKSGATLDTGSQSDVHVWDVTNPQQISQLNTSSSASSLAWTSDYAGERQYAAWSSSAKMLTPSLVGSVANQDIHAMDVPEMVIFSPAVFSSQAQSIASLHSQASDPIHAIVLDVDQVYNEFASGVPDVSALRKCLKMFYDRAALSDSSAQLRYALLLGRATYDNRHLTSQFDNSTPYTIPCWLGGERRTQLNDNTAYGTDDFIAILGDGSGSNLGLDDLCVGVGRIPATSADMAKLCVEKLESYMLKSKSGTWKNHFLFLADDGNEGVHVIQTESMINALTANSQSQAFVSKVYVDAYPLVGGICEGGRSDMYRMLDEGVMWWNFCGHANNHSWTGENMLTYNDINNLYLKKVPVLLAATCDFLRWDSYTLSGGEIMYLEQNGGTIATISATRPVYITHNGYFTSAMGRAITKRDDDGKLPRLGDIYRMAKNNILNSSGSHTSNSNRLRYALMGDPALTLQMPSNIVSLDSIGGQPLNPDDQITLKALERTTIAGSVTDPLGQILEDFNGSVEVVIYDAENSKSTYGTRDENVVINFDVHGDKLFAGNGMVTNGRFSMPVSMPGEVADNFRPASINMYAASESAEAVGLSNDFFVYGIDETVPGDTIPPAINAIYLNHSSFNSGDRVNSSPMLIAEISDDVAINLSSAGIGHEMTIFLDGSTTYSDVSLYYTPASDGTSGGTIAYPLSELSNGTHTLTLRVWDTNANSASKTIEFYVIDGLAPTIYQCYTNQNPVSDQAQFYLSHDRPDAEITVTVAVYSLMGRPVWESTVKGRADMFVSMPVTWNLCDTGGRRVPRGIYVYQATISETGGESYSTASSKLAVTGL